MRQEETKNDWLISRHMPIKYLINCTSKWALINDKTYVVRDINVENVGINGREEDGDKENYEKIKE